MIDTPALAADRLRAAIHYVCATPWNLLGMRHWLPDLHFLAVADLCDGALPRVAHARDVVPGADDSFERLNDRILEDPSVRHYIERSGPDARALFLMFDEANEGRAAAAGLQLCLPRAALRTHLDDKLVTTRLGNEAGVASVPNVLARVDGYATLRKIAAQLGPDLVVQTPFGDSGRTTFFIADEADFARHAAEITAEPQVKIMRRIRCRQATIEACVTRHGIAVGPLATELVGFAELTPYPGGWCGNEVTPDAFTVPVRDEAFEMTTRIGERLAAMGYRGVFGLDFLIDEDAGAIYLGELNPRITGATPITTQAARDLGCPPLVLLHLLEWLDVAHDLDLQAANAKFRSLEGSRPWGQLIIKELREAAPVVDRAPRSGIWSLSASNDASFRRASFDTGDIEGDREALVARTVNPGFLRDRGTPIARVLAPGRMMTDHYELGPLARAWTTAVRAQFS